MGTKAKTDYSRFTFTVKEDANGTPWIMCEPYAPGLPALGDSFLGLHLRPGISIEQPSEIAEYLREHVEGLSHTQFIS